jgi:hypothetical protein
MKNIHGKKVHHALLFSVPVRFFNEFRKKISRQQQFISHSILTSTHLEKKIISTAKLLTYGLMLQCSTCCTINDVSFMTVFYFNISSSRFPYKLLLGGAYQCGTRGRIVARLRSLFRYSFIFCKFPHLFCCLG